MLRIVLDLLMDAKALYDSVLPQDRATTGQPGQRFFYVFWIVVALAGLPLAWNAGQLPQRAASTHAVAAADAIAPDLALYLEVIARVRRGENYYAVAAQAIPSHGFPTSSPLNWRLPTYAWLLACFPCAGWIQLALVGLSFATLAATFAARQKTDGLFCAGLTTLLMIGVIRWCLDGYACVAQEPWAATLIALSLAAHQVGQRQAAWRYASIAAGIGAVLIRELALPFCGIGLLVAIYHRRWAETATWAAGLVLFVLFYTWHVSQVQAQLALSGAVTSPGMGQWLRLGGLDFVLLSLRMNGLLFSAPGAVLWLFLLAALYGCGAAQSDSQQLMALAAATYIVAFAIVGRPENFYWGLIPAPLLAWAIGSLPRRFLLNAEWKVQSTVY